MDLVFPPGERIEKDLPLARYLPPLPRGSARRVLEGISEPGELLLDPFGASPQFLIELAQSGRAVITAVNNPITRFVLKRTAEPFSVETLQTALARLAASSKNGGRLEPFLLDLYRTECSRCGGECSAEYFVWDRESGEMELKAYLCPHCGHSAEETVTELDRHQAASHQRRGLQQALALERVAPQGDPDRAHAEAALSVYPSRVLYALVTLINKLEQLKLEPPLDEAARALMLGAFEATNALWGYPEGRTRPLQLVASLRYREANVWRALEQGVAEWALPQPQVTLYPWEGNVPKGGEIAYHSGPVREILPDISSLDFAWLMTVFPRPNQAYWTLSALWTAWLWGREEAAQIKVALRRLRYDWSWHSGALRAVMAGVAREVRGEVPVLAFMPDAEPGFVSAALAGLDAVGYRLSGQAMRVDGGQALLRWNMMPGQGPAPDKGAIRSLMRKGAVETIQTRGEPLQYPLPHLAAWGVLAHERRLRGLWEEVDAHPVSWVNDLFEEVMQDRDTFLHLGKGIEVESGHYWIVKEQGAAPPLSDRVEAAVLEALRASQEATTERVDRDLCTLFPGLLTPDRRLIMACLESYGEIDPELEAWKLRPEDEVGARRQDIEELTELLVNLGFHLDYRAVGGEEVLWEEAGQIAYRFRLQETAQLGEALRLTPPHLEEGAGGDPGGDVPEQEGGDQGRLFLVVPGGRASLIVEKARRDPRIRAWLEEEVRIIKFRHIRRLASDTALSRENLLNRLRIDPPEHQDPQMPLL